MNNLILTDDDEEVASKSDLSFATNHGEQKSNDFRIKIVLVEP